MDALNSQSKKQTSIFSGDYELCLYTCEIVKEWFIMQTNSFELMINLIFITTKNLKTTKKKRKIANFKFTREEQRYNTECCTQHLILPLVTHSSLVN